MQRRLLIALLVAGVVCAGVGVALAGNPFGGAASFGWTAYSPLSGERYQPIDPTWLLWRPRVGLALLAIGAGSAGAALSALIVLKRRTPRS